MQIAAPDWRCDSSGHIYISDSSLNQIQVLGHEGGKLYTFDPEAQLGAQLRTSIRHVDCTRGVPFTQWIHRVIA